MITGKGQHISECHTSFLNTASASLGLVLPSLVSVKCNKQLNNLLESVLFIYVQVLYKQGNLITLRIYSPFGVTNISLTKFDGNAPTLPPFIPIHHPSSIYPE